MPETQEQKRKRNASQNIKHEIAVLFIRLTRAYCGGSQNIAASLFYADNSALTFYP